MFPMILKHRARLWSLAWSILLSAGFTTTTHAQSVDPGFNPNVDWAADGCCMKRILHAPGGGYYLIGSGLYRLDAHGKLDPGFDVGASGTIDDAVVLPDGRIVIVGDFDSVGGIHRPAVARLLQDGSLDTTFDSGMQSGRTLHGRVFRLADGTLLASSGKSGGFVLPSGVKVTLVRLSAAGTVDASLALDPMLTDQRAVLPLADGRLLWFGEHWDDPQHMASSKWVGVLGANGSIAQERDELEYINLAGDNDLWPGADGRILVAGLVPSTIPPGTYNYFGKLTPSLTIDVNFQPDKLRNFGGAFPGGVGSLPDGRTLFVGNYWWHGAETSSQRSDRLGRVRADGARDPAWVEPVFNGSAVAMLLQADGSVVVGGQFTAVNGVVRLGLARIRPDAVYDPIFRGGFE